MRRLRLLPLLLLLLTAAGCASSGGSSDGPRRNSNVLTFEELQEVNNLSVYDAIQRLRPQWLRARTPGALPVVFMNGSEFGALNTLRSIQTGDVEQIRYRNGRDATTRYGTGYGGGSIEITTR